MTTNDLEKYFRSNATVEVVSQAIVLISFVGDIMLYFRDIGPGETPGTEMAVLGHSRLSEMARFD